jgi:hypothetical protein
MFPKLTWNGLPVLCGWLTCRASRIRFISAHYGVNPENLKETHATTLDYIVAATAG